MASANACGLTHCKCVHCTRQGKVACLSACTSICLRLAKKKVPLWFSVSEYSSEVWALQQVHLSSPDAAVQGGRAPASAVPHHGPLGRGQWELAF